MMKKLPWHEPKVLECITRLEKGLQAPVPMMLFSGITCVLGAKGQKARKPESQKARKQNQGRNHLGHKSDNREVSGTVYAPETLGSRGPH